MLRTMINNYMKLFIFFRYCQEYYDRTKDGNKDVSHFIICDQNSMILLKFSSLNMICNLFNMVYIYYIGLPVSSEDVPAAPSPIIPRDVC